MIISVIITAYNHEKYIAQCLRSVLQQKGDFQIEIVVGDDNSLDNTLKIIQKFSAQHPEIIFVLPEQENLGVTKNLKRCLNACSGEYIAICEGDDYWTDEYKLQKQSVFLEAHRDFSMCFSAFMIYHEDKDNYEPFQNQLMLKKDILSTEDLILSNSIGNFSCCMYRTDIIKQFPENLYDLFAVDWMFNMMCGQFGKLGFIRDWMSVYRKHSSGAWAGRSNTEQATELIQLIDDYNRFFDFKYNSYFLRYREAVENYLTDIQKMDGVDNIPQLEYVEDEMLRQKFRDLQITAARNQQVMQTLSDQLVEREQVIQTLLASIEEKENNINAVYQSTSWKVTRPLRVFKSLTGSILSRSKSLVRRLGTLAFYMLPVSMKKKQHLRDELFRRFGFFSRFDPKSLVNKSATDFAEATVSGIKMSVADIDKIIKNNDYFEYTTHPENDKSIKISVVVISFNQERYIAQCLEGVFRQKGNFTVELILGDDCSTDKTLEIIKEYIENHSSDRVQVKILAADENIGMTKNLQRCLYSCTGDYIAVCEGDDYWIDYNKLQKQVNFLILHPECALCFNDIYAHFQESGDVTRFHLQQQLDKEVITTRELVLNYYIGNLSCCMYDARFMEKIPAGLFDLYIGDWMLNIYYSQFGDIGHLKEVMSVYRKHNQGVWTGGDSVQQTVLLHDLIEEYNRFLNYDFDSEFSAVQQRMEGMYPNEFSKIPSDIIIIDDIFPHPLSAFRMQEFSSYLKEFKRSKIYSTGASVHVLGRKTLAELFVDFKRNSPELAGAIKKFAADSIISAKLLYFVFLMNAYINIEKVEELNIPFVFTLYPGGYFGINNSNSDKMLKRVTSSPCFRKVIVTQNITYEYLIEKKFCRPDQIEFIFGVVTPLEKMEIEYNDKMHFGNTKDTLDICFVSHKYTKTGVDKGYDVFVDVAKRLCAKYDDIYFHVVGGFDENTIDIFEIRNRISFHGNRDIEWFNEFYKDKDIILSPNIPFMIFEGSFDGFPTGTCVDAGLRETAIFCTDELKLNDRFFTDGEEIVIIPHNSEKIVDMIAFYYHNPEKLEAISKGGRNKIKKLYSYEAQMLPRINILQEQINLYENNKKAIIKEFGPMRHFQRYFSKLASGILARMKVAAPVWLKDGLKHYLPASIRRMYDRFSM